LEQSRESKEASDYGERRIFFGGFFKNFEEEFEGNLGFVPNDRFLQISGPNLGFAIIIPAFRSFSSKAELTPKDRFFLAPAIAFMPLLL
jgi:hypothetical protein